MGVGSVLTTGAVATDADDAQGAYGQVSIRVRDAQSGTLVAARVRVVPQGLFRKAEQHIAGKGLVDLRLPNGRYDLIVSHGSEWSIDERVLEVSSGAELRVDATLEREVEAAAYTACDFHVHTHGSPDSDVDDVLRADTLLAEDVQFAVVTDHNRVTDVRAWSTYPIGTLPGVEVTTWQPEFGHFNVFPVQRAPRYKHSDPAALLAELRAQPDSFIQINHPRLEDHIGYFELLGIEPTALAGDPRAPLAFDGLEVWNGYDLARPARRDRIFEEWLALLARGHRLVATGNSDSHSQDRTVVGYPRTYVQVPREQARESAAIVAALKAGRAFVTSGPILQLEAQTAQPGDTLSLAKNQRSVRVRVTADGPDWMDLSLIEIWVGERLVREVDLSSMAARERGPRYVVEQEVAVADERSLVAVVRGERSMRALIERPNALPYAFTNPIWLTRE